MPIIMQTLQMVDLRLKQHRPPHWQLMHKKNEIKLVSQSTAWLLIKHLYAMLQSKPLGETQKLQIIINNM